MFYPEGLRIPLSSEYRIEQIENCFTIYLPKGKLIYYPAFFKVNETQKYVSSFLASESLTFKNPFKCLFSTEELENATWTNIPWKRDKIKVFGKEHFTPRLSSWHGNVSSSYSYSNTKLIPHKWTEELLEIKDKVESVSPQEFNSVLLNWYRDGNDHMGWHSDNEKELGINPTIASINLGTSRKFILRRISNHQEKVEVVLNNGDLLFMTDETQHFWHHHVPKQKKILTSRFNLTFRMIVTSE